MTVDGERTVAVPGAFTLRDSHPAHGVLVSEAEPVPRLFSIPTDALLRLFGKVG